MPQIDYPDFTRLGTFQTGKPRSERRPYFIYGSVEDWSAAPTLKRIAPEQLTNNSQDWFFLERILFVVAGELSFNTANFFNTTVKLQPTSRQHWPWMDRRLPLLPLLDNDGELVTSAAMPFTPNQTTRILTLPAPYPFAPNDSMQIEFECALSGDDDKRFMVCLCGYTESQPAYTAPTVHPLYYGQYAAVQQGELGIYEFEIAEPFIMQNMGVRIAEPQGVIPLDLQASPFRYQIKGQKKIIESPAPIGAFQDYHSRFIPTYDAKLRPGTAVQVSFLNNLSEDIPVTLNTAVVLRGYRDQA